MNPGCQPETFWTLFKSLGHWEFEIFLQLVVDGLIMGLGWRFVRKHWGEHKRAHHRD